MKEFKNLGLTLLGHCIVAGAVLIYEHYKGVNQLAWLLGLIGFSFILITGYFLSPYILSWINQVFNARIRGLWYESILNNYIVDNFNEAEVIKIKVTRGSIFLDQHNGFYKSLMEKNPKTATTNEIRILLHYPCQHSEHLHNRAQAHKEEDDAYILKLNQVIYNLLDAKKKFNLKLSIKLYGDQQINWRYYIFEKSTKKQILYLGYYDEKKKGSNVPMLKVLNGTDEKHKTLCDDFNEAFDDIFNHKSFEIHDILGTNFEQRKNIIACFHESEKCKKCHEHFKKIVEDIKKPFGL